MSNDNEGNRNISVSSLNLKKGKGSTGVDLRWHSKAKYKQLSEPQKEELRKWKKSDDGKKATEEYKKARDAKRKMNSSGSGGGKLNNKKLRKAVAAALAKEKKKEETDAADKDSKLSDLATKLVSSMAKANAAVGTKVGSAKVTFDEEINAKVAAVLKESNIQFK